MNISMEEKKKEAIKRMKFLRIYSGIRKDFENENIVSLSEMPLGAYYYADNKQKEIIKEIEKNMNCLVYTGIRSYTNFGLMDAFFFVSDYKEGWKEERQELKNNEAIACVYNHDIGCTDVGTIGFKRTTAAGLIRTF